MKSSNDTLACASVAASNVAQLTDRFQVLSRRPLPMVAIDRQLLTFDLAMVDLTLERLSIRASCDQFTVADSDTLEATAGLLSELERRFPLCPEGTSDLEAAR
jgi:hypothetical protein